jgi:hypothetical protein
MRYDDLLLIRVRRGKPVPVTGFDPNFSPIPRIAPPPLGRDTTGGDTPNVRSLPTVA